MIPVFVLDSAEFVPHYRDYVMVVEDCQEVGGALYTVTVNWAGDPGGPMPSGEAFRNAGAAIAEADRFASSHKLEYVFFRSCTPTWIEGRTYGRSDSQSRMDA